MRPFAVSLPVRAFFGRPGPAALLLAALLAAPAAAQDTGGKPPAGGAGGKTEAPAGPTEKDLLAEYGKASKSTDMKARAAAITALGDMSRELPDKGVSKAVAKTLAKGLDEDDLEVRSAAVAQLSYGRDVDTVIATFKGYLDGQLKEIEKRITRPDEESKSYVTRATTLLGNACAALANYHDDRSVDILSSLLRNLKPNSDPKADGANVSTRVVGPIATALLSLGTHEAVENAIKQCQTFVGDYQEPAARNLHAALAQFATKLGAAPPDYSENFSVTWHEWFQKNGEKLPKKLGKLKEPPAAAPEGMSGADQRKTPDGSPERP